MNNLLVFGSGNSAKRLVRYIDNRKNKILCYLDNDAQKWGKRMFGKRICSPDLA